MIVLLLEAITNVLMCCFLFLLGLWCWIKWTNRELIKEASKLQSVFPTLPFLGSLHYGIFGSEKLTGWTIESISKLSEKGVSAACIWIGPYPIICVLCVEDIQKVNSSIRVPEKGFDLETIRYLMGDSLLVAPANIWKRTRRAMDPIFHPRNMKQLMPTFNRNTRELVARISHYDGQGSFDVAPRVVEMSLQTICHLIFGPELEFDIHSEEFYDLVHILKKGPEIAFQRVFKFWLQSELIFTYLYRNEIKEMNLRWEKFSKAPLKMARHNSKIKEFSKESSAENDPNNTNELTTEGPLNLITVCDELLKNHPDYTELDVKREILTLYFTGSDTVSYAVSACFLLLAYHQDIQEKLYEEISSVVDVDRDVTTEDVQNMTYLDQVFKETLRWSMVVVHSSRRPNEDIKLSSCTIPKGSSFVLAIVASFLNSKIFPNPSRFDPDNFSPENSKGRDRSAFLPFNAGPRYCIGKLYTELLAKVIVVHVLKHFKLSTKMDVYNLKRRMAIFLYCPDGYNISIQRRSR